MAGVGWRDAIGLQVSTSFALIFGMCWFELANFSRIH
jgi:hypothetical protein